MLDVILATLAFLLVISVVGLGPAVTLVRTRRLQVLYAFAVAPAMGLAVLDILGFSLIQYIGPVSTWVPPTTVILVVISVMLLFWDWRRNPSQYSSIDYRSILLPALLLLAAVLLLLLPIIVNGINYVAFRSNPSDAFTYMSLAESARVVDWELLQRGKVFSEANLDNLKALAEASPTALLTARFLNRPMSINHMSTLAWFASLMGLPVYRLYYAFHMVLLASAMPVLIAVGVRLRLRRWVAMLAGIAIALGFWSRFTVESDASFELGTVPLLALLVFAQMQLERRYQDSFLTSVLFVALLATAIGLVYIPVISIVALAVLLLFLYHVFVSHDAIKWLKAYCISALAVIGIVFITGQLPYHFRGILVANAVLDQQKEFRSDVIDILGLEKLAGFANAPVNILIPSAPFGLRVVGWLFFNVIGIIVLLSLLYLIFRALRSASPETERVIAAIALAGLAMMGLLLLSDNARSAGKAFTYTFPYFLLGALAGLQLLNSRMEIGYQRWIWRGVSAWLAVVILTGVFLPYWNGAGSKFARSRNLHARDYELAPIINELQERDPRLVAVSVPREESWYFPYYVMHAIADFPTLYLSGLVIDNSMEYRNLFLSELLQVPNYVIILKDSDYLHNGDYGRVVAETDDIRLYEIVKDDISPHTDHYESEKSKNLKLLSFPHYSN